MEQLKIEQIQRQSEEKRKMHQQEARLKKEVESLCLVKLCV